MRELAQDPGFRFADLLQDFALNGTITPQNAADFYWARDLHDNERGYTVMCHANAHPVVEVGIPDLPRGAAR